MLIRLTLPLKADFHQTDPAFPTNEEIQSSFRRLGLSLAPKIEEMDEVSREYVIERGGEKGETVPLFSTKHFRDLAAKNLGGDDIPFSREISEKAIFFGAADETRTLIVVTRITEGQVALQLWNKSLKGALETLNKHIRKILSFEWLDEEDCYDRAVELHSSGKIAHIFDGKLRRRSLRQSLRLNLLETTLMCTTATLAFALFSMDTSANESLKSAMSILPENWTAALNRAMSAWPFLAVASLTYLITILIKHFNAQKQQIRMDN